MKKSFLVATAAALTVTVAAPTYAATNFADMQSYDEATKASVNYLVERKVVNGTSATTFSPRTPIKRGQVVKMLGKYLKESGVAVPTNWETTARFKDVPVTTSDRELLQYAALVYDAGIFMGSNGQLNAAGELTRENVALVLNRLAQHVLKTTDLVGYAKEKQLQGNVTDIAAVKAEAKEAVLAFNALGISNVTTFNPKGTVQRVHFASFLAKMLQQLEAAEKPVAPPTPSEPEKPVTPEIPTTPTNPVTPSEPEKPVTPTNPVTPSEPEKPVTPTNPVTPSEPEKPVTPTNPTPSEPEKPVTPTNPTPSEPEKPTTPTPTEPDEELEEEVDEEWEEELEDIPTFVIDFEDIENAKIVSTSATSVTIEHATYGTVKLGVDPSLSKLFSDATLLKDAIAGLYIEEDVIMTVNELVITNAGTAASPIVINGTMFDDLMPLTIQSAYATVENFGDYYGDVVIDAPSNATYTLGAGEFPTIKANGTLNVTFSKSIDSEVTLQAPLANVTIAAGAIVSSITTTNELAITVQSGGKVEDVYLPSNVSTVTVNGHVDNVTADTTGELTLNGTGVIGTLYGEATALYAQQNGVTVNYISLSEVDEVTIK